MEHRHAPSLILILVLCARNIIFGARVLRLAYRIKTPIVVFQLLHFNQIVQHSLPAIGPTVPRAMLITIYGV